MQLRAIVALVVLCGCSAAAPPATTATATSAGRTNPRAPAVVRVALVEGEPTAGRRITLRADLEMRGPWPYPVALEWRVPPGARLVSGTMASVVDGAGPATVELELGAVPAEDLVVVAESRGPDAGFHAEARYRFGRPDPAPPSGPEKTGPSTTINGHDLGPSVPMN